jgi:hypothetical protein
MNFVERVANLGLNSSASGHDRFVVVRDHPPADLEQQWRKCLQDADFATHYTTPEFFRAPFFRGKKPFTVLSIVGREVAAVPHRDSRSVLGQMRAFGAAAGGNFALGGYRSCGGRIGRGAEGGRSVLRLG